MFGLLTFKSTLTKDVLMKKTANCDFFKKTHQNKSGLMFALFTFESILTKDVLMLKTATGI